MDTSQSVQPVVPVQKPQILVPLGSEESTSVTSTPVMSPVDTSIPVVTPNSAQTPAIVPVANEVTTPVLQSLPADATPQALQAGQVSDLSSGQIANRELPIANSVPVATDLSAISYQLSANAVTFLIPEEEILTGIATLIMRGHLTGELLEAFLPGGIQYVEQPDGEIAAKFDPQTRQVIIYSRSMKVVPKNAKEEPLSGEVEGDPLELLTHQVAHALLTQNKLLYTWEELAQLIQQPQAELALKTITPVEQRTLLRAHLQPEAQLRWETPLVAMMIRSHVPWAQIVLEMLAERLRVYLMSSATFPDFLEQRLSRTLFMQMYTKSDQSNRQPDSEILNLSKELHDFARGLGDLPITEARGRIDTFFAEKFTTPHFLPIQQEFHDVVLETYVLFWRYSHVLRGDEQQRQLVANLKSGSFYTSIPTDLNQHFTHPDHILASLSGVTTPRDKSLWQLIAEALSNLPR